MFEKPAGLASAAWDKPVSVTLKNTSNENVESFWIDYDGKERSYGVLYPGQAKVQGTYATHPFLFRSQHSNGPIVGLFIFDYNVENGSVFTTGMRYPGDNPSSEAIQNIVPPKITIRSVPVDSETETSCHDLLKAKLNERTGDGFMGFKQKAGEDLFHEICSTLRSKGKRFVDEDFKKGTRSKRAYDIFKKDVALFKDGISPLDPKQGQAGDCWLIEAISGAARRPDYVKDVFCLCENADPALGIYAVTFINGYEKMVILL